MPGEIDQLSIDIQGTGSSAAVSSINALTASLQRLQSRLNTTAISTYGTSIKTMGTSMQTGAKSAETASRSIVSSIMRITAAIYAVRLIGRVFSKFVDESTGYIETLNMVTVSLGSYADAAIENAKKVEQAYGLNSKNYLAFQSSFALLFEGFGNNADQAYTMSENLTNLGYDLASLRDISFDTAMTALESGITGQTRSLKKYGIDVSNAALSETALAYGITEKVNAMTQAEKATLRYLTIMDHSDAIQNDMARTITSTANQLRILKDQLNITARALGNIFIPAINAVIPYVIAFLQVVATLANALATLFGFELPTFDYSGISSGAGAADDLSDSLDNASGSAKKLKGSLAGFDELNVITQTQSSGSGGSSGGGSSWLDEIEIPTYEFLTEVESKATAIRDTIIDAVSRIKEMFQPVYDGLVNIFTILNEQFSNVDILSQVGNLFWAIVDYYRAVAQLFVEAAAPIIEALDIPSLMSGALDTLITGIETLTSVIDTVRPSIVDFVDTALAPIASWLSDLALDGLTSLNTLLQNIGTWVSDHQEEISSFFDSLSTLISTLWGYLEPVLDAGWDAFKEAISGIFDALATAIENGTLQSFIDLITQLIDLNAQLGTFDNLSSTFSVIGDFLGEAPTEVLKILTGLVDAISSLLSLDAEGVISGLATSFEGLFNTVVSLLNIIINNLNIAISTVNTILETFGADFSIPLIPTIDFRLDKDAVGKIQYEIQDTIADAVSSMDFSMQSDKIALDMTDWTTFETDESKYGPSILEYLGSVGDYFSNELAKMKNKYGDEYENALTEWLSDGATEAAKNRETIEASISLGEAIPETALDAFNEYQFGAALSGNLDAQMYIAGMEASQSYSYMKLLSTMEGMGASMDENFALGISSNIQLIQDETTGALTAISNGVEINFPVITQTLYDNFLAMGIDLQDYVSNIPSGIQTALKDAFANTSFDNTATGKLDVTIFTSIEEVVSYIKTTTTAGASAANSIKNTVISHEDTTVDLSSLTVKATTKAGGGFVDSGDFFFANENGVPEFIGSFGGKSAVANTDQIVEGISAGVSAANSEQNSLLREQNTLLRALLEKDSTIEPSAAWGAFNAKSQKLYAKTGG